MNAELIYWDSDPFLAHFQEEVGKVELCAGTIERAEGGEVLIVTSALTIAEVLWKKKAPKIEQEKADILRRFFRRSHIRVYNIARAIAEMAQDVVWNHGIQPKDALHVATALQMKVPVLETFDGDLLKKSGMVGIPPLVIRLPIAPKQTALELKDRRP